MLYVGQKAPSRSRRRGAFAVEAAMVLLIFCMLLFAVLEYGRYMMVRTVCEEAAREGARWAVVNTGNVAPGSKLEVRNKVANYLGGTATGAGPTYSGGLLGQITSPAVDVFEVNPATGANIGPWTSAAFGKSIAVTITGTFKSALPNLLLLYSDIPINVMCIMKSEAN